MRRTHFIAALSIVISSGCAGDVKLLTQHSVQQTEQQESASLLAVVKRRTTAYNAHDIEAFLAVYAENVRIYEYPEKLLGTGRERMRRIFGPQFSRKEGTVATGNQYTTDSYVVSVESLTLGTATERVIAIYFVENGLIAEVRLIEPAG